MKTADYILIADRNDESAVDYTLDKCGAKRFWVPTPFGVKMCTFEATWWTLVKFVILLGAAWFAGKKLSVKWRRAPGD